MLECICRGGLRSSAPLPHLEGERRHKTIRHHVQGKAGCALSPLSLASGAPRHAHAASPPHHPLSFPSPLHSCRLFAHNTRRWLLVAHARLAHAHLADARVAARVARRRASGRRCVSVCARVCSGYAGKLRCTTCRRALVTRPPAVDFDSVHGCDCARSHSRGATWDPSRRARASSRSPWWRMAASSSTR